MKTPYDELAKIYTNCTCHMIKMATTPIYGKKKPLNIFFSGTKKPKHTHEKQSIPEPKITDFNKIY